ncbi:uncharacterized protein LOC120201287 [Hibiscus syriacus]|uniref:uncharacterized protein LOC120201287 n=1 Tax=Hibiscus syriacus TaxID=106335 RepID=UPI0019204F4E|nr:uncharacterized protein LOC120201287 [Hibiscus syriacus]
MAISLRDRFINYESSFKTSEFFSSSEFDRALKTEDETALVLISHLSSEDEDKLAWPSQVLCSIVFPKFLVLADPASRLLLTSTIEYFKLHQRATVHGLLFPLVLQKEGINTPICDVMTRIEKECLHLARVSVFCRTLLCWEEEERRFILLPCHEFLFSNELVWTDSLFNLLHNILNHNVHLTQDSVDRLVYHVRQMAETFSKSLKFGNLVLRLVTKCSSMLDSHEGFTDRSSGVHHTFVTRSILSRIPRF